MQNPPENVEIDEVVAVDQSVPQPDNFRPGDFGKVGAFFFGGPTGRLAYYFQQPHKSEV